MLSNLVKASLRRGVIGGWAISRDDSHGSSCPELQMVSNLELLIFSLVIAELLAAADHVAVCRADALEVLHRKRGKKVSPALSTSLCLRLQSSYCSKTPFPIGNFALDFPHHLNFTGSTFLSYSSILSPSFKNLIT